MSRTGEAVRLISGAHGFPGRSQGLKSATLLPAGFIARPWGPGVGRAQKDWQCRVVGEIIDTNRSFPNAPPWEVAIS